MIDMSKIPTITRKRYCTSKTRFAHIVLHDSKSEETIIQIFTRVLQRLTERLIIVKSDCALEYHTHKMEEFLKDVHAVKEMRHSNEHNQAANSMVEKFGHTLGRGLRVALIQSGLPLAFWGAAAIMVTDLYNSTPRASLGGDSPYFWCTGRIPDMSFFRPFGCSMVVFRGKDLVEHGKLAPRGEKGVCVGIGTHFGRRVFICYSARTNRVYASVDCKFDTSLFPFQVADQRQREFYDQEPHTEELSMFNDMPNATIDDIIHRINSESIPCNTTWAIEQVMETTSEMQAVDPAMIQTMHDDERVAYGLQPSAEMQQQSSVGTPWQQQEAADTSIPTYNITIRNVQSTIHVHDRPGSYATLPEALQDAGSQLLSKVTNAKLAEYLIGMSSVIPMSASESCWPEDGCQWSVMVMEDRSSKRHHGGHAFSVVLAGLTPAYTGGAVTDISYVAKLSSKQIRNSIEQHYGKNKTLQQMFDPKWQNAPTGMTHSALAFKTQLTQSVRQTTHKIFRKSTASPLGNLKRNVLAATGK